MSKKIDIKLDRSIYVTSNYNEYSDEFDFGLQTWEPGKNSDSFVVATIPFEYNSAITREDLVIRQLGKLDTKEADLREEFNKDIVQVKHIRDKLMAIGYDTQEEKEHEAALVNDLGPEDYQDTNDVNDDMPF